MGPKDIATIRCSECGGNNTIRHDSNKGKQIYMCKSCGKRHTDNCALPGRRIPPDQVSDAVGMFYEGLSTEQIRRNFGQKHSFYPSTATVYEWVVDYTNLAKDRMRQFKAHTGETGVCDEMVLKVGARNTGTGTSWMQTPVSCLLPVYPLPVGAETPSLC